MSVLTYVHIQATDAGTGTGLFNFSSYSESPKDIDLLHQMHRDPVTMETLGGVRMKEQTIQNLQWNIAQWDENGFGLWMFYEKNTKIFVGYAGLRSIEVDGTKEVEFAYSLMSKYWKRGYATEMSKACLEIAFDKLHVNNIIAKTRKSNLASQRIINKLGFSLENYFHEYGHEQILYRLTKLFPYCKS